MLVSSSLHSACNVENMDKAFLISIYKILRQGIMFSVDYYSIGYFSTCCAHPNRPDFSYYGKSCHCWHEKSDLGTLWKLHVYLQLALFCLKKRILFRRKSHESIIYGGEKLQHRVTFTQVKIQLPPENFWKFVAFWEVFLRRHSCWYQEQSSFKNVWSLIWGPILWVVGCHKLLLGTLSWNWCSSE